MREQADSKIRELKALTAKRPESGKKILRAATQKARRMVKSRQNMSSQFKSGAEGVFPT